MDHSDDSSLDDDISIDDNNEYERIATLSPTSYTLYHMYDATRIPPPPPPLEPVTPHWALAPFSIPTFYQLYQQENGVSDTSSLSEDERVENEIQESTDTDTPRYKRPRKWYIEEPTTSSRRVITLSLGHRVWYNIEDEIYLLTPRWYESCSIIRCIVARVPHSVEKRLNYLSKMINEEEGYDDDGNMTYYNLKQQVFESYLVETRLKRAMKNLLMHWRNYTMDKKMTADHQVDPITLSEPEKAVVIYDWSVKRKFIFDAKSLAIWIESNLLHHQGGFSTPQFPRNPWTNVEFTYRQIVSIYFQLRDYGELRWGLTTLREYDFDLATWHQYHHSTIIVKSIRDGLLKLDTVHSKELLEDFIISFIEDIHPVTDFTRKVYHNAIIHLPNYWYIEHWKLLAFQYYEGLHFKQDRSAPIRILCERLLKRQYILIKHMIEHKYV